jgi:hypothetical protein
MGAISRGSFASGTSPIRAHLAHPTKRVGRDVHRQHPIVVEGAGHSTLQTDRQDAQVTSEAIEQVAEAVRTDRPLTR